MCKLFLNTIYSAIVAMMLGAPVVGAPSGLNVIPTADVLDKGVISLETESAGNGRPWGDGCDRFSLLQIGGGGVEFGVDRCLNDRDTWLNVKWRAREESGRLPAVAFGVQGISVNDFAQPYLAATKSVGGGRLHAGIIRIDRKARLMLGLDRPLSRLLSIQADYTSGSENSITYGIALSLSESVSLTLAQTSGNAAEIGRGHVINIAWSRAMN